jgi:hypothetical protein
MRLKGDSPSMGRYSRYSNMGRDTYRSLVSCTQPEEESEAESEVVQSCERKRKGKIVTAHNL